VPEILPQSIPLVLESVPEDVDRLRRPSISGSLFGHASGHTFGHSFGHAFRCVVGCASFRACLRTPRPFRGPSGASGVLHTYKTQCTSAVGYPGGLSQNLTQGSDGWLVSVLLVFPPPPSVVLSLVASWLPHRLHLSKRGAPAAMHSMLISEKHSTWRPQRPPHQGAVCVVASVCCVVAVTPCVVASAVTKSLHACSCSGLTGCSAHAPPPCAVFLYV
jgi:hypothetical protein